MRGKCREFLRKRFTFPRGHTCHRLHSHLSPHLPFLPPGKVPRFPAKMVHFPPWPDGVPALQASLAALAVSTSGESAAISCENGALSPVAGWGTGSTGLSRRTHRFHLPGKCREFLRFWFTFPRGLHGHRLYRHLSPHLLFPPLGKVPGISAKTVHFPRGLEKDRRSNGGIDVIGYSAPFSFSVLMLIHGDRLCGKGGFSRYFATFVV